MLPSSSGRGLLLRGLLQVSERRSDYERADGWWRRLWRLEQPQLGGKREMWEWESNTPGKDLKAGAGPGRRSPGSTAGVSGARRGTRVTVFPRNVGLWFQLTVGLLHHVTPVGAPRLHAKNRTRGLCQSWRRKSRPGGFRGSEALAALFWVWLQREGPGFESRPLRPCQRNW